MNSLPPESPVAWQIVLRWIGFLPASIVSALIAVPVVYFIGKYSVGWAIGDDPADMWILQRLAWYFSTEMLPSGVSGYLFVYVGCLTAPSGRKIISCILMGIALLLTGFSVFSFVLAEDWSTLVPVLSSTAGSCIAAGQIMMNDDFFQ